MSSINTRITQILSNDQHNATTAPLYQSTTFKQTEEQNNYDYTRSGNPTRTVLEDHLTKIVQAEQVYAVTSGMSCLDVVLKLLKSGDEVIAGEDLYGGSDRLLNLYKNHGIIELKNIDTTNFELIKSTISLKTKLILLESPTNPLLKIVDLPKISSYIRKNFPDCLIIFDNTMMSPILSNSLQYVDIQYESATKYLNGHHDIMAGIIEINKKSLVKDIYFIINSIGCGLAPFECWLLLRGLKTLSIRIEKQQSNTIKVIKFFKELGFKVNYPGSTPEQLKIHNSYNKGIGCVFSIETNSIKKSENFMNSLKLFSITVSFGSINSLVSMPCQMSHASIDPKVRELRKLPEDLIRFSIGIEDVDDLINDLRNSLLKNGLIKNINGNFVKTEYSKL